MEEPRIGFNCESCGADLAFSTSLVGTVQECPQCFDFVDVPEAKAGRTGEPSITIDIKARKQLHVSSSDQTLTLDVVYNLPHPRWPEFQQSLDEHVATSRLDEVYNEAARLWLDELARVLPEGYQVSESAEFYLLSHSLNTDVRFTLKFCERSRRTILDFLDGVAADRTFRKHIVLAFADDDSYYSYASFFNPDGEFGAPIGMFLNDGYGHTVCMAYNELHRTIAHEMIHCLLQHLPLPLWINEGVTQIAEDKVMDDSWFLLDSTDLKRIRTYWSEHGLVEFWNGDSFYSDDDDGQELSYMLARIIVMRLFTDTAEKFWEFVRSAEWSDGGRSAYRSEIGGSLEAIVLDFIEGRDWLTLIE